MICEATKLCGGKHGCGRVLPVGEFYCTQNGPHVYCRACTLAATKRWAAENPERRRENSKRFNVNNPKKSTRWATANPIPARASGLVARAKRRGGTDIDIGWVMERLERGVCELSGIPFVYEVRHPCLPSIDRIDPTQPGHMKDNCRVILWGLNAFKGTASEEVFLKCLEKVSAAFVKG